MYMAATKLHSVGFECPTLAANSLFMDSRKLFVRLSLLIVLEGLRQDEQQTQPQEQLPGTQGQFCVTGNVIFYIIDLCNDIVYRVISVILLYYIHDIHVRRTTII